MQATRSAISAALPSALSLLSAASSCDESDVALFALVVRTNVQWPAWRHVAYRASVEAVLYAIDEIVSRVARY